MAGQRRRQRLRRQGWGAQVDFIGRVGDDDTGNSLLAELESWGVNTRYTKRYNQGEIIAIRHHGGCHRRADNH